MQGGNPKARRRIRRALLVAIGLLYIVSIPWYRTSGAQPELWLGLPDWGAVAVLCYGAAALLNAAAWLLADVSDDDGGGS